MQAERKIRLLRHEPTKRKRYSYEHPIKMKILIRTSDATREKKNISDFSGMGP